MTPFTFRYFFELSSREVEPEDDVGDFDLDPDPDPDDPAAEGGGGQGCGPEVRVE